MTDRIPATGQEGRVLITPESGEPFYAKIQMADNPTEAGTPLNKANLLTDATAAALGLAGDPTVDDAFNALAKQAMQYDTYTGSGNYGSGNETVISFAEMPKFVIITSYSTGLNQFAIFSYGQTIGFYAALDNGNVTMGSPNATWDDVNKTLSILGASAKVQLNVSSATYNWYAIGGGI